MTNLQMSALAEQYAYLTSAVEAARLAHERAQGQLDAFLDGIRLLNRDVGLVQLDKPQRPRLVQKG